MRVSRIGSSLARRAQGGSPRGAASLAARRWRPTVLVTVTALIYLVHAAALAYGSLLRPPGMNPPRTLDALALGLVGLASYALIRGPRFGQGEATVLLALQLAAAVALTHGTHRDLAALTNGVGLSMLGAYASWLLGWPAALTFYAGLSAWIAVVVSRSDSYLTVAAVLLTVQAVVTSEILRALRHRVLRLTHFDPLTGTFNRRGVEETLAVMATRSARRGMPVSVALIDLDDLRQVNNSIGHLAGDRLLVAAADEWRLGFAPVPVAVGRIGGDEFVLLFDGADDGTARTLLASAHAASTVRWTAGVAQLRPGETLESALARADTEMYANKNAMRAGLGLLDERLLED